MDWSAIGLSLRLGILTSLILTLIAFPIAYLLSRLPPRLKFILETLILSPLIVPPTVLGFIILRWISPNGFVGSIYSSVTGLLLPFSFQGLLIGAVICSLPLVVLSFAGSMSSLDRGLLEAARGLGASRWQVLVKVVIPLCFPGGLAGIVLSFAHTLGEFGVVMMIGGDIPGATRTASISIYDDIQAMNYDSASGTSFFLLTVSFGAMYIARLFWQKSIISKISMT